MSPDVCEIFHHEAFGQVAENREYLDPSFHHDLMVMPADAMFGGTIDVSDVEDQVRCMGWAMPLPEACMPFRIAVSDEEIRKMGFEWLLFLHRPLEETGRVPRFLAIHVAGPGSRSGIYVHQYSRRLVPSEAGLVLWNYHPESNLSSVE